MYWKSVISQRQQELYELWHDNKKLLSLEYHPFTNSARIQYEDTKRVFMLRKEGFLRNKTVLRDEYGIRIGQLGYDKAQRSHGTIELHDKRFSFALENAPLAQVVIRSENEQKPQVICGLNSDNGTPAVKVTRRSDSAEQFLMMSLCWYLFLPIAKEHVVEYAI